MESTVWERILSHGREKRVQRGLFKGGGDLTNLDYIVQRCALFVLAKHVETVTARMIDTQ